MNKICNFFIFLVLITRTVSESYTPIVLWHGMVDTCCNEISMDMLVRHLKEALPGVHTVSLMIGNNTKEDLRNGFLMHPNEQIEIACSIVNSDPLLADGYNAIGVSQGSQLIRGLLQRCPGPRMKTLITMAGQHQGYYGIPFCDPLTIPRCDFIRKTLSRFAYLSSIQKQSTQATFWHDSLNEETYKHKNTYIAEINNERVINKTYITKLQSLENFVMIKYEKETMVIPKDSSWFEFYAPGQSTKILPLRESDLYISDRLGLKQMDQDGKLHFILAPWVHWEFDWTWYKKNVVDVFLK
ncbi:hypothetical protein ILUMI_01474 [Ignelater luminosus]|uniref:Palmitoyl-protein thioesterase 1 n=1 Tax=Ignelater luminosus TaxID=2038154 RepID=A0A8K0GK84_IGNLU|nr:hypothetical protein ILUMI_01474 [Ignelater luminosus]